MSARKTAQDRKAQIIDAALMLSDRLGPDRMTTNDVARAVGLTQPGVFRHFPTKQALWLAVAEVIAARLDAAWDAAIAAAHSPEDRLRGLVLAQLGRIEACPALPAILFSRELNIDNPPLREAFRTLLAGFQGHLVAELSGMQRGQKLRSDIAPEDAAVFLTSLVQGLAIRWSLGGRAFPLVEEGARLLDLQLVLMRPCAEISGD